MTAETLPEDWASTIQWASTILWLWDQQNEATSHCALDYMDFTFQLVLL